LFLVCKFIKNRSINNPTINNPSIVSFGSGCAHLHTVHVSARWKRMHLSMHAYNAPVADPAAMEAELNEEVAAELTEEPGI
jgi:hypothetical protein